MSQPPDAIDFLEDILDAAQKAESFVAGMTREQFVADDKTRYAVVPLLTGAAVAGNPREVRGAHPRVRDHVLGLGAARGHDPLPARAR